MASDNVFKDVEGRKTFPAAKVRPTPSEQSGDDADVGRPRGVLQSMIGGLDTSELEYMGRELHRP